MEERLVGTLSASAVPCSSSIITSPPRATTRVRPAASGPRVLDGFHGVAASCLPFAGGVGSETP